ncbi:hypothetical protein [Rhodococcus sp. NCIMB 12038]|nr:hypothetical protein [Rhodococcus sp. NCIMB 12038]
MAGWRTAIGAVVPATVYAGAGQLAEDTAVGVREDAIATAP